jgi:outer membrane protein X
LNYGTGIKSSGIGVKYQYNLTDNVRLEPSMNYFFENEGMDQFDLNANVHYLFPMASYVRAYPLAGLTFARWDTAAFKGNDVTRLGINAGGGIEFDIADKLMLNFELKYQFVSDFDQTIFNVGVSYIF